jgi:ribosomal protein S18 acetylase RimI-like enzyme
MLARGRPRRQARRIEKNKSKEKAKPKPKKNSDAARIKVNLKLFSPSKAKRWDPRHASSRSSPNYTLIMAAESDMDEDLREEILDDRRRNMYSDSEYLSSDSEDYIPDWEDDPHSEFKWLEVIRGEVTLQQNHCSTTKRIGDCKAYLIRRHWIADNFWDDMEEPEHEMAELAFELFGRFGCLQPQFKDHPVKRGSGVWSDELNNGDILLIEDIRVSPGYRRQGIGSKLALAILELTSKNSREFFAITWPGVLESEVEHELSQNATNDEESARRQLINIALRFWRTLGFRRIGSSRWLGYTPDQNHPSYTVPLEQDFDLPSLNEVPFTLEMDTLSKALPTINDTECLTQLRNIFGNISPDDMRWEARDKDGNTLLHLLPCSSKIQSTHWLMHRNQKLCHALNADGSTPLDVLEASMERKRTIHEYLFKRTDISDRFTGFDHATISCLALLRGLIPEKLSEAEVSCLKFGCTCGSCLGGFLSPRLRDILVFTAEITFDDLYTDGDRLDGEDWCSENKDVFTYLPEPIQQSFTTNKGMRTGFSMLWKYLASCLKDNMLPTEENILLLIRNASEWPPHCRNFIQKGGAISSAATMLFKKAMDLEEWYDLVHEDTPTPVDLPSCRNDREFGLVSGMCGYERVTRVLIVTMSGKRIRY